MSHRSSNRSTSEARVESGSLHASPLRQRPKWHALIVPFCVLVPLLAFGLLAEDVMSRETIRFDAPFLLELHEHASPLFNTVMLTLSRIGGLPILAYSALVIVFFLLRKHRAHALFLLSAMVGTSLLNIALKAAFQRTRPDLWLSIAPEHDFSFPSGHSMLSCTFTLALLALTWNSRATLGQKAIATVVGVLFMGGVVVSRLYLGVHYPSDVLAGFCLSLSLISLLTGVFQARLREGRSR